MLSKKMTVSLMSLIIILALAFVAPSAMAQVKVTLSGMTSVPHGGTTDSPADTTVDIVIETDKAADMPTLMAVVFDKDGNTVVDNQSPPVAIVPTFDLNTAMDNTAKKRYITMTVPTANLDEATDLPARVVVTIPAIGPSDPSDDTADSEIMYRTITITEIMSTEGLPKVVSIQRLRPGSQTVVAAFQEERIKPEPFDVRIVLTERGYKPGTGDVIDLADVEVENGTASNWVVGVPFTRIGFGADDAARALAENTLRPHPSEGMYNYSNVAAPTLGLATNTPEATDDFVPMSTSANEMYYQFRVTITPHQKSSNFDIKIKMKNFHDNGSTVRNSYVTPGFGESVNRPNGRDILTIPVEGAARDLTAGYKVTIPADWIIPANGYLVIAQNIGGSEVVNGPGPAGAWRTNDTPRATHRTPAQLLYNVIERADLPNLATEFVNGVVVDVVSQHAGLVVSEVMWAEDVSLATPSNSQYIELYNPGGQYKTIADKDETPDVNEALTLIFYRPNEFDAIPAVDADGNLPAGITDRIGTLDTKGAYWSPGTKGQSGRSGTTAGEEREGRGAVVDPVPIVSMYRVMEADGTIDEMMGQMSANWASSAGPKSANFDQLAIGIRHGTPGAATDATDTPADTEAEAKAEEDKAKEAAEKERTTGTIPTAGSIYISEIMFAGGGSLPQWIEISNGSRTEDVNLSGWTITVNNAAADTDVSIGASATITIPDGTMIYMSGQSENPSTILVVTEKGRTSMTGPTASGQIIVLDAPGSSTEVDLINAGVLTGKYTLLSGMAFEIILAPPAPEKTNVAALAATATAKEKADAKAADIRDSKMRKDATDIVGNLGDDNAAAWALPMSEDGRSSIIRRHVQVTRGPAEPEDGTMMKNWVLASDTAFGDITHIRASSYYGAANDVGTPGFRPGGALPVELSHFRPARDKATSAVVITWSTQSELNNAGFFIKRSQQRDGEFKVINAAMVPGAGTTSEKQFYTYTDTTAQPNVVYYYQIEDVSLDGQRQTLTRGIRLKGHVSVAGKLTSTWGELKNVQ